MSILSCKSLREVETILEPKFEFISIISEVPVAKSELLNLEQMFKHLFSGNSKQQSAFIKSIWRQYPLSCLAVTVYIGIYYYDGNYWGQFTAKTGCTDEQNWKECFMEEIERRNLFVFDRHGAQRYVSTILGHAGVPQISFEGFANGFLKPTYESQLTAAEALFKMADEDYDNGFGIKPSLMHKGVRDYLRTGGKVAEDFVERCLQLIPADLTSLESYQQFLPRRILKLFQNWQKSNERITSDKKQEHVSAPEIKIDPYLDGVYLQLPIQQFKAQAYTSASWRIHTKGTPDISIKCDFVELRSIGEWQVIPRSLKQALLPDRTYEVDFEVDSVCIRKWRYQTTAPLIFDKKSFGYVRSGVITNSDQWIVLSKAFELSNKKHESTEVLKDNLYGPWSGYSLWEIGANVNTVLTFSDGIQKININIAAESEKPFLKKEPGSVIWQGAAEAFYHWPVLCVPAASFPDFRSVSSNWNIQINHPQSQWRSLVSLNELADDIKLVGSNYEVSLSSLCPESNYGKFNVSILAGLGSDIHLSFIKLPESLRVEPFQSPAFPLPNGIYQRQIFRLLIEKTYVLSCIAPNNVEFISAASDHDFLNKYQMMLPEKVTRVTFQLYNLVTNESCEVQFLPRALSWHLVDEQNFSFQNEVIRLNEQELYERSERSRIVIDTSNMQVLTDNKYIDVTMRLVDHKGSVLMEKQRKIRPGTQFTVDPMWFIETIRSTQIPYCRLWIDISHWLARPFIIMEVSKKWMVTNVRPNTPDSKGLHLCWNENYSPVNRVLRIWDEWHPWNGFRELTIPDGSSELLIENWHEYERGHYLFEWSIQEQGGLFSFLEETLYPTIKDACYRLYNEHGCFSFNPLAEPLLGGQWNGEMVHFTWANVEQIVQGIEEYGEYYVTSLPQPNFRRFFSSHKRQIINCLTQGLSNHSIDLTEFLHLIGINEWSLADIEFIGLNKLQLWGNVKQIQTTVNEFGPTKTMISMLVEKPAEDLNQIRQIIPPNVGILERYNIPVMIVSLILRCKTDLDFQVKLREFVRDHTHFIREVVLGWRYNTQHQLVMELLDSRWDSLDEPGYINYPYYVAATAAGLRLMARTEQPAEIVSGFRRMEQEIRRITPEWLEHDLYFMEATLSHCESETTI